MKNNNQIKRAIKSELKFDLIHVSDSEYAMLKKLKIKFHIRSIYCRNNL